MPGCDVSEIFPPMSEEKRKLTAINMHSITPEVVVHSLLEDLPKLKQLFVVAIDKDEEFVFYAAGTSYAMCARCPSAPGHFN